MSAFKLTVALVILLSLSACVVSRFKPPLINVVSNSGTIAAGGTLEISASCPNGQPLLGGGYRFYGRVSYAIVVLADFPQALRSTRPGESTVQYWTTKFRSISATAGTLSDGPTPVDVYAYCYARQASSPITTVTPENTQTIDAVSGSIPALCPAGYALTGGGFQNLAEQPSGQVIDDSTLSSYPATVEGAAVTQLEWKVDLVSFVIAHRWNYSSYAICATGHMSQNSIQSASAPSSSPAGFQAGNFVSPKCPNNSFTTGAGYAMNGNMPQIAHNVSELFVENDWSQAHMAFDTTSVPPFPRVLESCVDYVP